MIIFRYDRTFEGLLTAIFDAYFRKVFPDALLGQEEPGPLFIDSEHIVITDKDKTNRVWEGLEKKVSANALNMITHVWLSEIHKSDELIFRYIRKTFDNQQNIETNYADDDVLQMQKTAQKVSREKHRLTGFVRFIKTSDDIFLATLTPDHNTLPLIIQHFKDRFRDQQWIIYDLKRNYGYYYNLKDVSEMSLNDINMIKNGQLDDSILAGNEKLMQQLWKQYFKSMTIKERINVKLQKQHMPVRYWKFLTEK